MLTKGDDYPLHQTPEPIAYVGANRNFYDRFFFNGYDRSGEIFFALAMGVYPYLNVMDGAFTVVVDGVQHNVLGSKAMHMERLDTSVGNVAVNIIKPMEQIQITCDDSENGISADLVFNAVTLPHEEPRFTRRTGSQVTMDVTRMMQNGIWTGWINVKGKRIDVIESEFRGTRDRSWGIRSIGAADAQANPAAEPPQYYWLWAPLNFDGFATHYFVNEDKNGEAWNSGGTIIPFGNSAEERMKTVSSNIVYAPGTRHASDFDILFTRKSGEQINIKLTPKWHFYMKGIGYGHPEFGHGSYHGELATGYDEYLVKDVTPDNLHIQAMCDAIFTSETGESKGQGVLEQLIFGPHQPSGFKDTMDFA